MNGNEENDDEDEGEEDNEDEADREEEEDEYEEEEEESKTDVESASTADNSVRFALGCFSLENESKESSARRKSKPEYKRGMPVHFSDVVASGNYQRGSDGELDDDELIPMQSNEQEDEDTRLSLIVFFFFFFFLQLND
ncbi:hypothetical protein RFI_16693 [Reticulomyxa filosa]|uniref:Uncharacterized protein n=1 Tax=Reticulomyxa filosa TaxID=46433 RepID=X6N450_RETFI|nr:hypothetical protein RFI_16693 [Reticulomyxa filosa]|eukprot:ETO20524.1 hypothetical protein RFI_16693 [Reticulomyxa filosa]